MRGYADLWKGAAGLSFLLELQISWPLLVQEWQYIDVVDVVDVVDIDIGIDIASDGRLY